MYRIIHSDAHLYESLYRDHEPMYFKLALSTTASAYWLAVIPHSL